MPVNRPLAPSILVREPGRSPLHLVLDGPLEVGRDCSGLLIDDAEVSRCHLQLRPSDHGLIVEDLASSNGTFLDGTRLQEPQLLRPGSQVVLGHTTIELIPTGSHVAVSSEISGLTSIERVADELVATGPSRSVSVHPDATVTIVFTDIESSTELSARVGDKRWFEVISKHNRLLRARVAEHDGIEVKAVGDGFMLAFHSARAALQAMIAMQREVAAHLDQDDPPIKIRVGGHTGEAITDERGDLFGFHVNYAARVANEAKGGEILVSSLVKDIVEARGEFTFEDPRHAELKGFPGSHLLYPVHWQ